MGCGAIGAGHAHSWLLGEAKWRFDVEPVDAVECFEEGDQVMFFGVCEVEGGNQFVEEGIGITAFVVKFDDFLQGFDAAVVHIGGCACDFAQGGCFHCAKMFWLLGLRITPGIDAFDVFWVAGFLVSGKISAVPTRADVVKVFIGVVKSHVAECTARFGAKEAQAPDSGCGHGASGTAVFEQIVG